MKRILDQKITFLGAKNLNICVKTSKMAPILPEPKGTAIANEAINKIPSKILNIMDLTRKVVRKGDSFYMYSGLGTDVVEIRAKHTYFRPKSDIQMFSNGQGHLEVIDKRLSNYRCAEGPGPIQRGY